MYKALTDDTGGSLEGVRHAFNYAQCLEFAFDYAGALAVVRAFMARHAREKRETVEHHALMVLLPKLLYAAPNAHGARSGIAPRYVRHLHGQTHCR